MMHVLDSALRSATGGSVLAPVSISPLRAIAIDSIVGKGDSAWFTWETRGGGLKKGEMAWGHQTRWGLVRRDRAWAVAQPVRGTIGDGYIRVDLPKPPNAPECLASPAG
jgi:hypothetical protein